MMKPLGKATGKILLRTTTAPAGPQLLALALLPRPSQFRKGRVALT